MHTFCQYCIKEWKKNRCVCPICRRGIISENRNYLVDNVVNVAISCQTEEQKKSRRELVEEHTELIRNFAHESADSFSEALPSPISRARSSLITSFIFADWATLPSLRRGAVNSERVLPAAAPVVVAPEAAAPQAATQDIGAPEAAAAEIVAPEAAAPSRKFIVTRIIFFV